MSRSRVGLFAILSLWLLLEGCVIAPPRLAAPRPDEWRYRRTAEAFINYGVKDNISGMLRLTSPLVIRENSEAKVRSAFEKYSIPLLKGATVRLDMKGVAYLNLILRIQHIHSRALLLRAQKYCRSQFLSQRSRDLLCRWIEDIRPQMSQNYNRYSYCMNNPTSFTDPTAMTFGAGLPAGCQTWFRASITLSTG